MGRVRAGVVVLVLGVALFSSKSGHAQAGPTEANVSSYVSDEFKTVAKKLVKQYIGGEIKNGCPRDSVFCTAVVDHLVDAFDAVVDGDTSRLRGQLSSFFVDSALAGGVALIVDEITATGVDPSTRKKLRDVMNPIGRCVIEILKDHRTGCTFDKAVGETLASLGVEPIGNDVRPFNNVLEAIAHNKTPTASDLIVAVEAVVSSKLIGRQDLRAHLTALKIAADQGLEGGLFVFVIHMLDSEQVAGALDTEILDPTAQPTYQAVFAACGASAAWNAWTSHSTLAQDLKRETALGHKLPNGALAALDVVIAAECTAADKKAFMDFRRGARFLRGSLSFYEFQHKFGLVLPAIALVLDLVHSGDQQQFEAHARQLIGRALDQASWRICETVRGAGDPKCIAAARDGQKVCQTSFVSAVLDEREPMHLDGKCLDLDAGVTCTVLVADVAPAAYVQGTNGKCYFPELVLSPGTTVDERRKAVAGLASKYFTGALQRAFADTPKVYDAIQRAIGAYANNETKSARKIIARLAVETLLDQVQARIHADLGTNACSGDDRLVTVFKPTDAKCALAVLIEGAYYPIADFIWDGGIDAKNADQVASSAYEGIVKSKYLGGAPVIVDVGLGANAVWGLYADSVWSGGEHAFTIVDKFGLAVVKYNADSYSFQAGPFVGGFLDSIIRAIDGNSRKFWLAGLTVGMPRMFSTDFGLELHVALAMPYSLDSMKKDTGVVTGAVLVIPWDFWKEAK